MDNDDLPAEVRLSAGLGPMVPKDDYVALTRDARCEFAGWQQRFLCPDEGPGDWQPCTERDAQLLVKRTDYELRPVYAFRVRA